MLTSDADRAALNALAAELKAAGTIADATTVGQAMDLLMAADQAPAELVVSNRELRRAIDPGEYEGLPDAKKKLIDLHLSGDGSVDLKDAGVRAAIESAFPPGGPTHDAVLPKLNKKQSRLTLRGLPEPSYHQLAVALGKV